MIRMAHNSCATEVSKSEIRLYIWAHLLSLTEIEIDFQFINQNYCKIWEYGDHLARVLLKEA